MQVHGRGERQTARGGGGECQGCAFTAVVGGGARCLDGVQRVGGLTVQFAQEAAVVAAKGYALPCLVDQGTVGEVFNIHHVRRLLEVQSVEGFHLSQGDGGVALPGVCFYEGELAHAGGNVAARGYRRGPAHQRVGILVGAAVEAHADVQVLVEGVVVAAAVHGKGGAVAGTEREHQAAGSVVVGLGIWVAGIVVAADIHALGFVAESYVPATAGGYVAVKLHVHHLLGRDAGKVAQVGNGQGIFVAGIV